MASHAGAFALIAAAPSGLAMTVSAPFNTTTALLALTRAAASLEGVSAGSEVPNRRRVYLRGA